MAVITTARKAAAILQHEAQRIGATWNILYIPRKNLSLEALLAAHGQVLVLDSQGLSCHTKQGRLFFHPNMAAVRLRQAMSGQEDKMLAAMELKPGDKVLDCTAGLCSDSLVAAWRVGDNGTVTALENSLPIYLVVLHGLRCYRGPKRFGQLPGRIDLRLANFREFLARQPDASFDVVYFDPMFDVPVHQASSMAPLRPLATYIPLAPGDIEQARRVARKRVVVKQRNFFPFAALGLEQVVGSPNRKIAYGVLTVKAKE